MSNLNNVYLNCPGLMSDGRAQPTDYRSHNEVLKITQQGLPTSYDYRVKLQGSGLRDITDNIRYNSCKEVPSGEVKLNKNIALVVESGNYLDAFKPLASSTFFNKPVDKVVVKQPELTRPATKLPLYSPYNSTTTSTMAPIMAPIMTPAMESPMITPLMESPMVSPVSMVSSMESTMSPIMAPALESTMPLSNASA